MKTIKIIAFLIFLVPTKLIANQTHTSKVNTWAENSDVYILHSHRIEEFKVIHSETTIINKFNGTEILHEETAPFNILIPVSNGSYFAGLSYFKTEKISAEYNFALFSPDGRILSKANITVESGHCPEKYAGGHNYSWYSYIPEITLLPDAEQPTHIIVTSPNSMTDACEIPF